MSNNQPNGTLGDLVSGLFGRKTNVDGTRGGASPSRKLLGGALLAAGATYLYKRYNNGTLKLPGMTRPQ